MDYEKIGKFITNERKAKKLTQAKLAEKLFISEKTISKWENGNGIPDTSTLPKLCEILGVTLNELLSGERLTKENFAEKADEKILNLQKSKEETVARLLRAEIFLGSSSIITLFICLFASIYIIEKLDQYILPIIFIIVGFIVFVVLTTFCLIIEQKAGYYTCKKCEHKYIPTFKSVFFSPHINRTRYMKCPHCKEKSWHKKVVK